MKKWLSLFVGLVCVSPVFAQDTLTVAADTLVVSATRTERPVLDVPFAVDVLTLKDLPRAEAGLSLAEKLRYVPGLVVDNRQNLSQGDRITMRGVGARASFGVRGIRLVLDGIPLTMPDGQAQLNNLDLVDIERVEVLRGPSAALYGNASGGVILLHSGGGQGEPFSMRPSVVVGSDGLRRVQVQASGGLDKHQYAVSGYRLVADGYRDFSSGRTWALNAHSTYQVSDRLSLFGVVHHVDSPLLLNPSSLDRAVADSLPQSARFFVRSQGASKSVLQTQGGVTARYVGADVRVESTVYGLTRALYNPIPGRVIDLDRKAGGWRTVLSGDQTPVSWTVGLDVEAQRDTRQEFVNDGLPDGQVIEASDVLKQVRLGAQLQEQKESVTSFGPFVHLGWKLGPQWLVALGVRFDHFVFDVADRFQAGGVDASGSRAMGQWSPSLGVTFRAADLMSVYANVGTAFQTPTTTELGNRPSGVGGFNPDLEPERMRSFEVGLKGFSASGVVAYDLAGYVMTIRDMLIPFQVAGSEEIFYRNAGQTRNVGFETHLRWTPVKAFRADVSYSHQRFTFRDYQLESGEQLSGNRVPGVPPHRLSIGLILSHPVGAFAEVHVQATDDVFANDLNGPPVGSSKSERDFVNDGAVVTDFRLGLRRSFVAGYLGINNVFDTRYNSSIVPNAFGDRFFEPAAGRMVYAGLAVDVK
ncbi:MAG: iron complex outermembrane receptor protein [Candidatus Latescibacterota bacterium]